MENGRLENNNPKRPVISCYSLPRKWSKLSYPGMRYAPEAEEPSSGTWSTYFIKKDKHGNFIDPYGNVIQFDIRYPDKSIDFSGKQLNIVKQTLENLTDYQIEVAKYWGEGPATKQWTPIIDRLIDTYKLSPTRAARVLAAVQAAINDTFIVTWYFKFLWDIPRPIQYDRSLKTVLPTPLHPSYPSGHAAISGCAEKVLSYFFRPEAERLAELAEECAISRLYAGVHYQIDNEQGLSLGRQIGRIAVSVLRNQEDGNQASIDYPILENKNAKLPPPPYKQVIPTPKDEC